MDKYEYKLKLDQLKNLVAAEDYETAARIADTINWSRVRNANTLMMVAKVYEETNQYEACRDVLLHAYDHSSVGRSIVSQLADIAIKAKRVDEAEEYYNEFLEIAPRDNKRYVIAYKISCLKNAPLTDRIAILEELQAREYSEIWAYELAALYSEAGMREKCVETCDELILWFGEGIYVEKALDLKRQYQPLTTAQEEKYRRLREARGIVEIPVPRKVEASISEDTGLPDISVTNVSKFNTMNLQEELARSMQQIMEATERETVAGTMDSIKKIVNDIPYLTGDLEEASQEIINQEMINEAVDRTLKADFRERMRDPRTNAQVAGQMSIEDVLSEWEKTKMAAEEAIAAAEQKKLELAKEQALREANDIMARLQSLLPVLSAEPGEDLPSENTTVASALLSDDPNMVDPEEAERNEIEKQVIAETIARENAMAAAKQEEREIEEAERQEKRESLAASRQERRENIAGRFESFANARQERKEAAAKQAAAETEAAALKAAEETTGEATDFTEVPDFNEIDEALAAGAAGETASAAEEFLEVPATDAAQDAVQAAETVEDLTEEPAGVMQAAETTAETYSDFVEEPAAAAETAVQTAETADTFEDLMEEPADAAKDQSQAGPVPELTGYESVYARYADSTGAGAFDPGAASAASDEAASGEAAAGSDETAVDDSIAEYEEHHDIKAADTSASEALSTNGYTADLESILAGSVYDIDEDTKEAAESFAQTRAAKLRTPYQPRVAYGDAVHIDTDPAAAQTDPYAEAPAAEEEKAVVPMSEEEILATMEDNPEESTASYGGVLSEEDRKMFSYFLPVPGVEEQICQVLKDSERYIGHTVTSITGNIIIQGEEGSGKTVLATSLIKAIQKIVGNEDAKIGKISAEALNRKDFAALVPRLEGGYLIIDKAGDLNAETVRNMSKVMERNTGGLVILLEDDSAGIRRALGQDPLFAKKFTGRVKIPVFTIDELVDFGKSYAEEMECTMDEMAVLALYNRINNIRRLDHPTTLAEVKEIVDEAISRAEGGGIKKLFSKKYNANDYLILREKDFEY